ncbi:MAG TPA: hypothetical protein QKA08_05535 [Candidatus Megaira endosymbiont of Nemacystus decipiens]|nr:hypothetical protein [Candidatus Megaera endosymbiont of Nemacystus decipiens]
MDDIECCGQQGMLPLEDIENDSTNVEMYKNEEPLSFLEKSALVLMCIVLFSFFFKNLFSVFGTKPQIWEDHGSMQKLVV